MCRNKTIYRVNINHYYHSKDKNNKLNNLFTKAFIFFLVTHIDNRRVYKTVETYLHINAKLNYCIFHFLAMEF